MRVNSLLLTAFLSLLVTVSAAGNTVVSSTLEFEGTLTDDGDGSYSGVIPMIVGGAYDIYAEEGGTAWFGNDPGTGPVWTSQAIGADHDAWPTWNPDTPDWYQYSLELYADGGTEKWAVRNHAGATETNPWYDEAHWGAGGLPARGVPMSGLMGYAYPYAAETDVGAYLPGMGTPEIAGGAAGYGGGPAAWDMDWSWGSEAVPLEYSGFDVDIQDLGGGTYHVTLTPAALTEVWVDDDFTSATPGWGVTHFDNIQDGIDAVDGSTVNVANGTYTIATTLNVAKSVTIDGESEAGVVLDASGCAGYGMLVTADGVVLRDMTMLPPAVNYPIHASGTGNPPDGYDGLTIEHMTIEGVHQRTAFDIHGYSNVLLSYLTAGDATGGNGIQVTGCLHVDMDNIVTHDNAWGSIAIYCSSGSYLNRGSDDVDIDGDSCTLGEGNIYSQHEFGLTNTNVTVVGYEYLVKNDVAASGYDLFQDTLTDAATLAAALGSDSYIIEIATGDLVVLSGMSIQAAIDAADPGDTIEVAAGTYNERLTLTASIDLRGAQYGVDPTLGGRTNPAAESIVDITGIGVANPNVAIEIAASASGASVDGFTVIGSPTLNYADETVFRAWCGDLTIEDNIIDGYFGVLHKGGTNVSISRNQLTVNKGAITLQPGTYDSFTVDGNVAVLGSTPGGGESAMYMTSASNIDVTGNTFTGFPDGNGVGGSNNTSIIISGNDLSDNRKGVNFWGNTTFVDVTDNDIKNCSNAGVNIKGQDLTVSGNVFDGCDIGFDVGVHTLTTERVTATDNDFSGCVTLGMLVAATVTGDVDASGNYWGSTDPAAVRAEANGGADIDYTPWLGGGTAQNPGFAGDYATLYVDDDSNQTGSAGRIQEGIDLVTASTVNVAAGTYAEQVVIDKSMSLIGAGETATLIQPGAYPVISVAADDVSISDLAVTDPAQLTEGIQVNSSANLTLTRVNFPNLGAGAGPNTYGVRFLADFTGLTVTDCEFAASAASHGVYTRNIGIFAPNSLGLADFTIEDCTFDEMWTSIYIRCAIDGLQVTGCTFLPIDPADFAACVSGVYIGDGDDDDFDLRNISVTDNTFTDYGRGVYVWNYGANSIVENFVISGNTFTNTVWSSPIRFIFGLNGMENYSIAGIDINNNTFTQDSDVGAYVGLIDLRTYDATLLTCGISITDNEMTFTGAPYTDAMYGIGFFVGGDAFYNTTVAGNGINGGGTGGAGATAASGMRIFHYADDYTWAHALDLDIVDNAIAGFDNGFSVYDAVDSSYGGLPASTDLVLSGNAIVGDVYGVRNDDGVGLVSAEDNWWGDPTGPYHPTSNPGGLGSEVSDYVLFSPWITGNIICVPDPEYLSIADPSTTIDVDYLGGGSGLMYGYNVTVTWDDALVEATPADVTQGTLLSSAGSTFWNVQQPSSDQLNIDCIILGASPGVMGPGTMFSIDFDALVPVAYGVSPVDITVVRVRDNINQTLTGFFADDGEIIVDTTAPSVTDVHISNWTLSHTDDYIKDGDHATVDAMVTDAHPSFGIDDIEADLTGLGGAADATPVSYDGTWATWEVVSVTCDPSDGTVTVTVTATDAHGNSSNGNDTIIADNTAPTAVTGFDASPGNEQCDLTWTDGTDAYYAGTVVQRSYMGSEYPQYPWFVANWPSVDSAYPGNQGAGTNVYNGGGGMYTDAVVARNIYYYQAFSYDEARNYGPAATTARDLATNYWLGDVSDAWGSWGYDGLVDANDILKLSDSYGTSNPLSNPGDAECDVGPTVHPDWNRLGLPKPDDAVEFEDAMIFAMNYGVVTAKVVPFLPEEYSPLPLALTLEERSAASDMVEVALVLEGNNGEVKGVSAEVAYDASELEFVSARLSEDMSSPLADVFFWSGTGDGVALVDAMVLGTDVTIGGCGDVAVLTFRVLGGEYALEVESARIRNAENNELDAKLGDLESGGDVPLVFRLVQNAPNPFNPVTKIAYHIPRESDVTIRVYDVAGRAVRTLVDGVVEPGRHEVVWNGTNDSGESVGSGIYFCTMTAPEFSDSRKMTLLK